MTANIHDIEKFRGKRQIFADRFEAGKTLGSMLQPAYDHTEGGLILAIPSGGVPVGIKVSETLGLPLDLLTGP